MVSIPVSLFQLVVGISAFKATNGEFLSTLWRYGIGAQFRGSPVLSPDRRTLYVGGIDHALHALDTTTGFLRWMFHTNGYVLTTPVVVPDGSKIIFGSDDWNLYAVSSNGSKVWSYSTGYTVRSSPCLSLDSTVFFGSSDGTLHAIWTSNGRVRWRFTTPTGNQILTTPTISLDGLLVFFAADDYHVYAINVLSGSLHWSQSPNSGNYILSSPVVTGIGTHGIVIVGCNDGGLYALRVADGSQAWSYSTGGFIIFSPVLSPDHSTVYVGSDDTYLHAVETYTGNPRCK